jgi:aconitate hydratase
MDAFGARARLETAWGAVNYVRLDALEREGLTQLRPLPISLRVVLEAVLRGAARGAASPEDVLTLSAWRPKAEHRPDFPFLPARVLMQDFTGVPAVVDLAAMRSSLARLGGDPRRINPRLPVDLVIDHSVQVDFFASHDALLRNAELEFSRNRERYQFLRWAQEAFDHLRIVPPATGIVHQVNLEYLATVVATLEADDGPWALPDTLVGTDSHTTMVNGLGVLGWGVGGIEAEAAMLGEPLVMMAPDVVGFVLRGGLREGVTATDLTLTVTQILRRHGVVDKFVEFAGPGLAEISLPDRATVANMAPEYGATAAFFPVDDETLRYLRQTGRDPRRIDLVERYCKEQGLFRTAESAAPDYSEILELDLAEVEPSMAGPKRPQDRLSLTRVKDGFREALTAPTAKGGYGLSAEAADRSATVRSNGASEKIGHGAVVIAAITSCTNTSNPSVMVAAGLLAKKALERGLRPKAYVKTSMAPGSRVVTEYLSAAGLLEPLAGVGFNVVGYGCTTCIGNSGPLSGEVVKAIGEADLVVAAVLSGNRNFEGRVNPHVRANYLASPPLVVAYALAGTTRIDLTREPLGRDPSGAPVFLRDLWPTQAEVSQVIERSLGPELFRSRYADLYTGNPTWNQIPVAGGDLYAWDPDSTYIQEPPFFVDLTSELPEMQPIRGAHILALLGDSVTTDHISPAGAIPADGPAGRFLIERGVQPRDFNSFGSRRGNDRVMTRGTFGNIRLKNLLVPGVEGGVTTHFPGGERMTIYDAAMRYRREGVPLLVIAGKEYGTGSSRDWAAKGVQLLGVRAVIAESFERIHRSNLVGMGVLPLQFMTGQNAGALGLEGNEVFDVDGIGETLAPGEVVRVSATKPDGRAIGFSAGVRVDTPSEVETYRNGGILHMVLRRLMRGQS